MARALRAWAINRGGKNSVRKLRYGPRTRLVRGIYSLPCPFLFRKARGVILVSSTPQIRSLVTKLSKMVVFLSSDPSKFSGVPLAMVLSKSPFKLNIEIKVS